MLNIRDDRKDATRGPDNPLVSIQPIAIYAYEDVVAGWLETYLLPWELKVITQNSGSLRYKIRRCPFSPIYKAYFKLTQPSAKAIAILKTHPGRYVINYLEEALDFIFDSKDELEDATNKVNRHHVKKYQREQQVRREEQTRYTSPRPSANNFVTYDDKHCRLTGEQYCLHNEWRMRREGIKQHELTTWDDITTLDKRTFWKSKLIFKAVDHERLGQLFNKRATRTRDRKQNIRLGNAIMGQLIEVQNVIDTYKGDVRINDCLIPLDVSHLINGIREFKGGLLDAPFEEEVKQVEVVGGGNGETTVHNHTGQRREAQPNRSKRGFKNNTDRYEGYG